MYKLIITLLFILFASRSSYSAERPEIYDLTMYGPVADDAAFWVHSYTTCTIPSASCPEPPASVTHSGADFNISNPNSVHENIRSFGFGKVHQATTNGNRNSANSVILRNLLNNGEYIYAKLLHLHDNSVRVSSEDYISKHQIIGREGNTGLFRADADSFTHLHFEVSNSSASNTPWVLDTLACPGVDGLCAGQTRPIDYDMEFVSAHFRTTSVTDPTPQDNRYWYDPHSVADNFYELLPQLSFRPDTTISTFFGVAEKSIYGYLPVSGHFDHVSIAAKTRRTDEDQWRAISRDQSENESLFAAQPYLAQLDFSSVPNGIIGESDMYDTGDYLFLAELDISGPEDDETPKHGYPVKFSFVPNGTSAIIDNDEINVLDNPNYIEGQDASQEIVCNESVSVNNIPGYFLSAKLVKGQSGACARWQASASGGPYKVSIHIPEDMDKYSPSNSTIYKISTDGIEANAISTLPVDFSLTDNQGTWVDLHAKPDAEEPEVTEFYFSENGYVFVALGNDDSINGTIKEDQQVPFDAVKFECLANPIAAALIIDSSGSMSWNDPNGLRRLAAKTFIGSATPEDQIALIDFDNYAHLLWPISAIGDNLEELLSKVDLIDNNGGTSLSAGLNEGYSQLHNLRNAEDPCLRVAILLTDGEGSYNNQAELFSEAGWAVYTVGLGDSVDESLLSMIAQQTGGKYFHMSSANELEQLYFEIAKEITNGLSHLQEVVVLHQDQTVAWNFDILAGQYPTIPLTTSLDVPDDQGQLNSLTTWIGSDVETTLTTPSGEIINAASVNPAVFHTKGATSEFFRIKSPEPGKWTISIYGADIPAGGEEVKVSVSSRGLNGLPDNAAPIASAGTNQILECTNINGALVNLDGAASTDPDGDALSYSWAGPFGVLTGDTITSTLPVGAHNITLTVDDGNGSTDSDTVMVTVQDTVAPSIEVSVSPDMLWPPNHKMLPISTSAVASDTCDANTSVALVSVTSSESNSVNAFVAAQDNSSGDGNTVRDIAVDSDGNISLRAERAGTGTGRVYTITYSGSDASGNGATESATVIVPHDQ